MRGTSLWHLQPKPSPAASAPPPSPALLRPQEDRPARLHRRTAAPRWSLSRAGRCPSSTGTPSCDSALNCRAHAALRRLPHVRPLPQGEGRRPLLETLVVADVAGLKPGRGPSRCSPTSGAGHRRFGGDQGRRRPRLPGA
ncbi:uncharacterized protein A4U43_C06F1670 [Asparagus officinalis]|uniref:Uncharacterized protein n=1 Tax=Asparagus officinalis TaxID=4686 RepID=A0A5P1EIX9_ASPOF|nr:uncharacterized protein A4U43_C06F1670 [Asparagus officinalis]